MPWHPGCRHRDDAWRFLHRRHTDEGRDVIVGTVAPGPWIKALGVWNAAHRTDADVVAVADADVWCDGLDEAVEAVRDGAPWAVPHRRVLRLDQPSTAETIRTGTFGGNLEQKPYVGIEGGGVVVIRRDDLLAVPPDPRFVGWGQEDISWGLALAGLLGKPWRGTADLWHLWHPPQERINRFIGSKASKALWAQYRTGERRDPHRLAELVGEARRILEASQ